MPAGVRNIKIKFDGDAKGIGRAAEEGLSGLQKFERGTRKISKMAAGAFAGLAVGLGAMIKKTADAGDEIIKTAPKMGLTTDALQEMRHWADLNGISSETLERTVGRLNQRMGLATTGNETYADAFKALGIQVKDANGDMRETEDVMAETIAKLSAIEDPATRASRAAELLGTKTSRDLMPALEGGAMSLEDAAKQAHELGLVMDTEALENSAKFQDALTRLQAVGTGLITQFIIPFINVLVDEVFPFIENNIVPVIKSMSQAFTGSESTIFKATGAVFGILAALSLLNPVLKGAIILQKGLNLAMRMNPIGIVITLIAGLVAAIVLAWKKSETFRKIVTGAFNTVKGAASAVFNWIKRNWPLLLTILTGPIGLAVSAVIKNWDKIKSGASRVVGFIKTVFGGIADAISWPFRAGFDAIRSAWNSTVGGFGFSVPDWIPVVGGNSFNIPYLAEGGIVNRPTLAMIGEAGKEAVVPLDRADEFGFGGGVIENHIHIGDEVVRVVRTQIKGHDRELRRGVSMA